MRIVMTLLVRDESDVLEAHLRYHLEHGVDHVIATDNGSRDGSTEILESFSRDGRLHLIREPESFYRQTTWVTRMARLAATEYGADWVINSDADEFWWSRDGDLKDVLGEIPPRFGLVCGLWRHFVPRPATTDSFWKRMTVRGRSTKFAAPYWPPWIKVVHRAHPEIQVQWGNHDAKGPGLLVLRDWLPFEIFHFPIRSLEQMERKFGLGLVLAPHTRAMEQRLRATNASELFAEHLVDDGALDEGLRAGALVVDTRLRDSLDSRPGASPTHPTPSLAEDLLLAEEFDAVKEIDAGVRLVRRTGEFESRLGRVEAALTLRRGRRHPGTPTAAGAA
jgi:hypothetical protein